MEISMLKHFAAAALGFAILFGAIGPASAGKGPHYWAGNYPAPYVYSYGASTYPYGSSPRYLSRKPQPNIKLDLETESVWRNLRPEWFD
jgi:hypothetical protein